MNQSSSCEASTDVSCVVACCTGSSDERSNCWEANRRPFRDHGIHAGCCTWLQSSCDACTSSFSVSSEGSKLSAKGPLNASPTPGLNPIRQSHPGGGSLNVHVAQGLGEMTASLAAAASLALSITVVSFAQTLLATFSKPVSDQRKSLLGFETLTVGARMMQCVILAPTVRVSKTSERLALGH